MLIDDLKAFCLVCEQRSLAKAARKLAISAPMMTRRMQRIESQLASKLLNRSTRSVLPTEAGELFYQQAKDIISQYEASVASLHQLSTQVTGTIKIGLPVSISHLWVTPNIQQFIHRYPQVTLHIVNGNHLLGLLSEGFDLVIHCGQLPNVDYYYQKIGDWEKLTCAAPSYLKQHGYPQYPQKLSEHNCLDHYDNFKSTWTYQIDGKASDTYVNGNIKVNSSMDLKNLATAGLGLVYLPDFTVKQAIANKQLCTVLDDYRPDKLGIYAIYPSKQYLSKKSRLMLDYLSTLLTQTKLDDVI